MKNVSALGEFGLIETLTRPFCYSREVLRGVGDDCAVIRMPRPREGYDALVMTSDMLLEGRHFLVKKNTLFSIGHKAIACSISDIAAIGGVPRYAVVSLGINPRFPTHAIQTIYRGMSATAHRFSVDIVGGDTIASERLIIDVAMVGFARATHIVPRSGARAGDVVCVTGKIGNAVRSGWHLRFVPRAKESQALVSHFHLNAMIDLSDGLGSDVLKLCRASRKGVIYIAILYHCAAARGRSTIFCIRVKITSFCLLRRHAR